VNQHSISADRQTIDGPQLAVFNPEGANTRGPGLTPEATPKPKRKAKPAADNDLPLWRRSDGRWCRKIKGRVHYFGTDRDKALEEWARVKDDLLAGRTLREKSGGLVVGDLCERFLNAKRLLIESGELSPRTFGQYHSTCKKLVAQFGKHRSVNDLAADDFETLRAAIAKTCGVVGIANEIRLTRMVFKYAYDAGLIASPVRFGPLFKVKAGTIRKDAAKKAPRMFEAHEVKPILAKADDILKAQILLALNCGFGQADLSDLPKSALDLKGGWATFPRVKTGVERRAALWPETIAAIRKAIAERPEPKDEADADCVFLTHHRNRLVRCTAKFGHRDAVGAAFGRLLESLKLKRKGLQFYALRHTFRTIADETRDFPAIDRIMGHADHTMGGRYREWIDDSRLLAVSEHVRKWAGLPVKRKAK
jgi:integrase